MTLKKQIMAFLGAIDIQKRAADWLEKISVVAAGVALFQEQDLGFVVAAVSLIASFWLSWSIYKKNFDLEL